MGYRYGFSERRKVGKGAYGTVYKGELKNGEEIAVKMLHNDTLGFDDKQFENEFQNLMRLEHPNIVRLVAYCYETQHKHAEYKGRIVFAALIHRALCFEYMPGGSLENHLSDEFHGLDWPTRYKIIKGTCEGLKYLHEGLKPPIYHLDLKPGNILLDKNMVPKLADFGLSKLFSEDKTRITQTPIGTIGYLPPEYIENNIVSNKLDIFSLGVVMLKIIAGPNWRSRSVEMSSLQEFTDQVLGNWTIRLQETWNGSSLDVYRQQVKACTEIALKCVEMDRFKRPKIVDIINQINEHQTLFGKLPIGHGPEGDLLSDHGHERLPTHSHKSVTLESSSVSHLNSSDIKENQEDDQHSSSYFKEKEEDRQMHQIIPMVHPDIPVDVHPSEPWILTGNIFGSVDILNYNTLETMNLIQAGSYEQTACSAKFIARKQWFVVGCKDGFIRVYTYDSPIQKVKRFKAHSWNITCLDVHPIEPYMVSASSSLMDKIKLWDWNKGWECIKTFEMQGLAQEIKFNPKDSQKFVVASILNAQVWNFRSSRCEFTLSGHGSLVSSFDYFTRGNQLYIITGSLDKTAKIWDCQSRTCVQTLTGHMDCVTCVCSHPDLPILLTGSNDETVRLWNSNTFRLEDVLDFELGKVTAIVCLKGSKRVAIGHDAGLVITEIGQQPLVSHGPEDKLLSDQHQKLRSYSNEAVTLESRLKRHLNLGHIQENQEEDHHNSSCLKDKGEDSAVHQIHSRHPCRLLPLSAAACAGLSAAKLIARKQWLVVGHQDGFIKVYTYESPAQQVKRFKAHPLVITCLDVHPSEPYVLSAGTMDSIKLWDWNKGWECIKKFEMPGQTYELKFNPKDEHRFAVAYLLNTQVWNFRSSRHEFTLSGHQSLVSSFDYFTRSNQLYIITGSLDNTAKIWDCQSRTCVQTLTGHMDGITCVCSHPDLPILLTGSNDETVRVWNSNTFKLEGVLDFELGKVISIACLRGSKRVVIGHHAGLVITEIRCEQPGPSNR
uniref:Beta'-coat protein n=1 Tax=Leersia perrieri TaxID=77586 RepID=A0A0D9XQB6_9ORYZ